jgi:acyl carrier protein
VAISLRAGGVIAPALHDVTSLTLDDVDEEARQLIRTSLRQVAPDADLDDGGPGETLQEALDLHSIDFLNLIVALHDAIGLEIPERDYPYFSTLEGAVAYLVSALPAAWVRSRPEPPGPGQRDSGL